jgi:hypothetical protein
MIKKTILIAEKGKILVRKDGLVLGEEAILGKMLLEDGTERMETENDYYEVEKDEVLIEF